MDRNELYDSIASRTGGDIYIGVVGPVRTGKSTFIKRFMDKLIIPSVENEYERSRLTDELPQSAAGRMIMTTQPKFVPNEAAELSLGGETSFRVRLVDCVGYMVEGATGHTEDDMPRMVRTPWFDHDIPFEEAAEIGTRKVIKDHSTIGIVLTSDGSITQIPREDYIAAEERVIGELAAEGKPFIVLLNSTHPNDQETVALALSLSERYGVKVFPADVLNLSAEGLCDILELVLMEFPIRSITLTLPGWLCELGAEHEILAPVAARLRAACGEIGRMKDYIMLNEALGGLENFEPVSIRSVLLGSGDIIAELRPVSGLFYRVISEACGFAIRDDAHLISSIREFVAAKREYDLIEGALRSARSTGYGMVPPQLDAMLLAEPEIVRHGSRFGVRLKARATGLHIVRVDMESEVSPIVGSEEQSEEFFRYLTECFEDDPEKLWNTDIFGKSLREMVRDSLYGKVDRLPDGVQQKLRGTIEKMVNDGCNGLLCIMV